MKTLAVLLFLSLFCLRSFAQQMQEFNQLYTEHEYKKAKIAAAKAAAGVTGAKVAAQSAANTKVPKMPATEAAAVSEATAATADENSEAINQVSALPVFTGLLGKNILLPKIEISGITNFNSGEHFYGDVKVFTSAVSSKQSSNLSIFFPEASAYGISMSFNYLPPFADNDFKKSNGDVQETKWFCTYLSLNYLGKNLFGLKQGENAKMDTVSFTSGVFHTKLGIQVIPIRNILSFYTDVNFLNAVTNREPLTTYNPSLAKGFTNFWTIGTKMFLTKGEEKPLKLFLDFSFVLADKNTRTIYETKDAWLPKISIGGTVSF